MRIVMVASEVAPFSKEGGLADVIGSLPAGTPHGARLYPGFRVIDYFADANRYSPKAGS